jgi:leader peptidase (prepilin peptidase)/N-methyltransferase
MPITWSIIGALLGVALTVVVGRWPQGAPDRGTPLPGWLLPLIGAATLLLLALAVPEDGARVAAAAWATVLLLLAALDLRTRLVPNVIVYPALVMALVAGPAGTGQAVGGALIGLLFFGALAWLGGRLYSTPPLGMGDVKLAMLLGAIVGSAYVWPAVLLGMLLAGAAAAGLLATHSVDRRATLPYGSFLAVAGLVVLVYAAYV